MNSSGINAQLDGVFAENYSIDYSDYEYKPDEEPAGKATWIPIVYSLITIVGLLGNGLTLLVLARKWRAWRTSDTFVLNLCIADVLLLLTLPLWAAQAARSCGWCFGIPLCRMATAVFNINYFFGFLLLVCVSLDLYLSIIHGSCLVLLNTARRVQISCLATWLVSVLLTTPDLGATELKRDPMDMHLTMCVPAFYLPEWQRSSRLIHHILSLACVLVVCFSGGLLWVKKSAKTFVKRKRVVNVQLLAGVFILCWIPYSFVLMLDTSQSGEKDPEEAGSSTNVGLAATAALGCLHACLRPLLYLGLCQTFRHQTLAAIQGKKSGFKSSMWELGIGDSPLLCPNVTQEEIKQIATVEDQVKSTQS